MYLTNTIAIRNAFKFDQDQSGHTFVKAFEYRTMQQRILRYPTNILA